MRLATKTDSAQSIRSLKDVTLWIFSSDIHSLVPLRSAFFRAMLNQEHCQMTRALIFVGGSPLLQQGELDFSSAEEPSGCPTSCADSFAQSPPCAVSKLGQESPIPEFLFAPKEK
jgi:hypothetical protein